MMADPKGNNEAMVVAEKSEHSASSEGALTTGKQDAALPRPKFVWQAHPLRSRPKQARAGVAVILAVGAMTAVLCAAEGFSIWMAALTGFIASTVLVLSLHKFFFPSRFEIDREGITAHYFLKTQRLEWKHVRRFLHDEFGGYLSRRGRRTSVDAWQGVHILFGKDRDRAIQEIKVHIQIHGDSGGESHE